MCTTNPSAKNPTRLSICPNLKAIFLRSSRSSFRLAPATCPGSKKPFAAPFSLTIDHGSERLAASEIVAGTLARQRLGMTLMTIFGALALVLFAAGIYGVIAYAAAQRRTELATRIALGASSANIFWLVMRGGQTFALIGIAIGVLGAYLGGRAVAGSVFAMKAGDPTILAAAALIVAIITILATLIPAILSSRMDPTRGLRAD